MKRHFSDSSAAEPTEETPDTDLDCYCVPPFCPHQPMVITAPPPPPPTSNPITKPAFQLPFTITEPTLPIEQRLPSSGKLREIHRQALETRSILSNVRFRNNLTFQLLQPWATRHARQFSTKNIIPTTCPITEAKLKDYHASVHTLITRHPPQTTTSPHNPQKDQSDWNAFEALDFKYRERYGLPPVLQFWDYFCHKRLHNRQLRSFEWITRMTAAPNNSGEGMCIYWVDEHPMLPSMSPAERKVWYESLDKKIRDEIVQLNRQLSRKKVSAEGDVERVDGVGASS